MTGIEWEKYGIDKVKAAFEAESAKKLLAEEHFDILLCDIEMPGENRDRAGPVGAETAL